ncbi:unnamed protein product [Paramecium pentaurelia]|uniref:Ankyrin repeat protein n=1 Tax=Paramecium pentaurelia TaxID=43138 RepID=A0A8S1S6N1_9CILI|nr:unnamed protein product [Paramecium pentaurelia]
MQQEEEQYSCLEEFFIDSCRFGDYEDAIGCFEDNVDLFWIDINQNNCIHMVSANGHLSILEQIIQYSKKINIDLYKLINHQNQYGCTPLHWAVFNNQLAIIPVLLQNGADIKIKNLNGLTCIEEAIQLDKTDVIELLSKNISLTEDQQQTFNETTDIIEQEEEDQVE